ncbi:PaaI family thioesterase [Phenylobacterium sp. LH3H17]|uniref:PaaI family thioesterase n=1 Tax=Phenylobacterium sp. LH3H17 TaxID=2903901 RepID=UPI0020C9F4F6|nr:PaaI family thioesterase [Phenylobacterium sp. LH3H17]UTP38273.1 PaaI family thioesterase [Phenylobacterium sp. LH3H17]
MSRPALTQDQLQVDLDDSPFQRHLALEVVNADPERSTLAIRMPFSKVVERQAGTGQYHGGAIASLVDVTGDYALMMSLGSAVPTINFRVDYLRPAGGSEIVATALVRRAGRSIAVVDVDVVDAEGRLVAVGRGCYSTLAG